MKRLTCLLLCLVMASPVFAELAPEIDEQIRITFVPNCEERASLLRGQVDSRDLKILALRGEIEQLKSANETSHAARYVAAGFSVWGIATFGATGGLYPLVTGCLFLWGAMK